MELTFVPIHFILKVNFANSTIPVITGWILGKPSGIAERQFLPLVVTVSSQQQRPELSYYRIKVKSGMTEKVTEPLLTDRVSGIMQMVISRPKPMGVVTLTP